MEHEHNNHKTWREEEAQERIVSVRTVRMYVDFFMARTRTLTRQKRFAIHRAEDERGDGEGDARVENKMGKKRNV